MKSFAFLPFFLPLACIGADVMPPMVLDTKARPHEAYIRSPDGVVAKVERADPTKRPPRAPGALISLVVPDLVGFGSELPPVIRVRFSGVIGPDGGLRQTALSIEPSAPIALREISRVLPYWRFMPRTVECGFAELPFEAALEIDNSGPSFKYVYEGPALASEPPMGPKRVDPVKRVAPEFPKRALGMRPDDVVFQVLVQVDPEGKVSNLAIAPHTYRPLFAESLDTALRQWEFAPEGKPFCGNVIVQYKLLQ